MRRGQKPGRRGRQIVGRPPLRAHGELVQAGDERKCQQKRRRSAKSNLGHERHVTEGPPALSASSHTIGVRTHGHYMHVLVNLLALLTL